MNNDSLLNGVPFGLASLSRSVCRPQRDALVQMCVGCKLLFDFNYTFILPAPMAKITLPQ
jgi:hypothetical protein